MPDTIYDELARHLDENIVGAPPNPTFVKIVEILFPGQEAEVGLALTFEPKTLEEWQEAIPTKADNLAELLPAMARRGTVFTEQKPGRERVYRLLPSVVGFSETPFWSGKDTEMARALSPLWQRYFEEKFGEELERGTPLVRVIPIADSLESESEVLPYDALKEKVESASFAAVAYCPCRQMPRYMGGGCEHSLENCLHFGSMARYMVEQGMARQIDSEEVLRILKDTTDAGLVHICDNMLGVLTTVCSCCPCCCAFLKTMRLGHDSLSRSNYVAVVDSGACVGCEACEDRCPVQAIIVGEDDVAVVNADLCIGCGVCAASCATETLALSRRDELVPPPEVMEFVQARLKK
jgi:electron transport complex protein RnfB